MKAIVIHEYGGPEVLRYEDFPDPVPGEGELLVRVTATSINPIDIKWRSGAATDIFPIRFPGVIGVDLSGTVSALGPGAKGFSIGDRVFGVADKTYAELCVVKTANVAKIPEELDGRGGGSAAGYHHRQPIDYRRHGRSVRPDGALSLERRAMSAARQYSPQRRKVPK